MSEQEPCERCGRYSRHARWCENRPTQGEQRALQMVSETEYQAALADAWDKGFERGAREQGLAQRLVLVGNPYRDSLCVHCGHVGPAGEDHTCPCPNSDETCETHRPVCRNCLKPFIPVQRGECSHCGSDEGTKP